MSHRVFLCIMLLTVGGSCKRTIPGASCAADTDCHVGALCVSGVCILQDTKPCAQNSDCGVGPSVVCNAGVCEHRAPGLSFAPPFDVDYDCSGETCTGAVVNLAAASWGKATVAGISSEPDVTVSLQVGVEDPLTTIPSPAGEWSFTWSVGTTSGEVPFVVSATDIFGHVTTVTRKVLVDLTPPTCTFLVAPNTRRLAPDAPLVACSEPIPLSALRRAVVLDPPAAPEALVPDAEGSFHFTVGTLDGNTTYSLALNNAATDKAGNPAVSPPPILFRTERVLPTGTSSLGEYERPRIAVDSDGLPFVFAWDARKKQQVLFTWDGKGDGIAGRGTWISRVPSIVDGQILGPVSDFRLSQLTAYDNLALKHVGRVLMTPLIDSMTEVPTTTAYAESNDDLVTFHGKAAPSQPSNIIPDLNMRGSPAFVGGDDAEQIFGVDVNNSFRTFSWFSTWTPSPPITTGVGVLSQNQAGFIPLLCLDYPGCTQIGPRIWHVSAGDTDALLAWTPGMRLVAAGLMPAAHRVEGVAHAPAYVAWSERVEFKDRLQVGCRDMEQPNDGWRRTDVAIILLAAGATRVVGIDFGQGTSKVTIAVDTATNSAERFSQFGLLWGDGCRLHTVVDWEAAGGLVSGYSPTTAFSNDGVLWRALAGAPGLRVLPPIKP